MNDKFYEKGLQLVKNIQEAKVKRNR